MLSLIRKYSNWLHGQWPSGSVEKLPLVNNDGTTNIPGVYITGDLTGIPLLKFSADSGTRAVEHLTADDKFINRKQQPSVYDLIIIGAGVSGYAAAIEASKRKLNFLLLEASDAFSTIKNFPEKKPIFTYPIEMKPRGELQFGDKDNTKEKLLNNLKQTVEKLDIKLTSENVTHVKPRGKIINVYTSSDKAIPAHKVIIAIGRSGNYRRLAVTGEDKEKVVNRLHDPKKYADKKTLIVGGGDSALEGAIAIANTQNENSYQPTTPQLTLVHRNEDFNRAKEENVNSLLALEAEGRIKILRSSTIEKIDDESVSVKTESGEVSTLQNDAVLTLIGREAPLAFFRKSGIDIKGESKLSGWLFFILFFIFTIGLYDWKNYGFLNSLWGLTQFPDQMPALIAGLGDWWQSQINDRSTLVGTIAISMKSRSFYYTLLYTSCIGIFGWQRIKRRKTKYVTVQTYCLFFIQFIPLFLLPEVILPWLGYSGFFDTGIAKDVANNLFPSYISAEALASQQWPEWGHPRAYWHAYGFILAWPLNVYNVFTPNPMTGWLIISFIQTFILLPLMIYKYGKGVYCGWICSCGALAETMGDKQRHKMPHGPFWNKLNLIGQVLLLVAVLLLLVRVYGWFFPESWAHHSFDFLLKGENSDYKLVNPLSWKWTVDVLLGGILGVGLYFKYSGRVWCRFACPLAALMNIYARFSRFRIFANKDKCISCNVCTSVCHQGIDIMSFANKGLPMADPQCVRCSACIESCPTNVLEFGEINKANGTPLKLSRLKAISIKVVE
ncbi:NAD(P)-binding domain-containing protein [Aliikangiella coralliicola]|uniref:4Fe-4S binding protein n=1 Tax=Aliikangiella coralliicola TaxID=2592383 RepID=A0A545UFA3_9GAMM|nr:NAD(P)-binding domain-containing protein [Aliikangiella coralliicola]TQV88125.1 4Fe-4S binding protein [Aliikangiella coralliicola]